MAKGLFSFFGFLFLTIAIGAFTTNVFLTSALDNFDVVSTVFDEKSSVLVEEGLETFYAQLSIEQQASLDQVDALTAEQRALVLTDQCKLPESSEQPYCHPKFISGEYDTPDVLQEAAEEEFSAAQKQAFDGLRTTIEGYKNYPLIAITFLAAIISLLFYWLAKGLLPGIKTFSGTTAWLSALSAVLFKIIPLFIEKLISIAQGSGTEVSAQAIQLLKDIATAWLVPAMNDGFIASVWVAGIAFVIWLILKFTVNYSVEVDNDV